MVYMYGDIPEELQIKPYLPLFSFLWKVYKELGWDDGLDNYEAMGAESIYAFFETRLNESILTAKDVLADKFPEPEKIMSYILMLPNLPIRSDLSLGINKLFGGDSCDVTFCAVNDTDNTILALLNCHEEDGIPVDWWMIREDDELLDRRHMKYGYKLRDIPKKAKNMKKGAIMLQEVLKDIRNERSPQWSDSGYFSATLKSSWAINLLCIPSNYEALGDMYDGWASKELYGLPDYTFALLPFPTAFSMFLMQGRDGFMMKLGSLTTQLNQYILPWEEENYQIIQTRAPGVFNMYKNSIETEGIHFPIQSLHSEYPNMKLKDPNIKFDRTYPEGQRIMLEDLEVTFKEFTQGIYLNINHETEPQKVTKEHIISKGIGRETIFM